MELNAPTTTQRRSGRLRIPNINHQEVLTLREAAEVRSQLMRGKSNFLHPGGLTSIPVEHPADPPHIPPVANASTSQSHISRGETLEMSVSTLFRSLHLDGTDAGRIDQPDGTAVIA